MKSDIELSATVEEELEWEPSINAAEIGVAVRDGIRWPRWMPSLHRQVPLGDEMPA